MTEIIPDLELMTNPTTDFKTRLETLPDNSQRIFSEFFSKEQSFKHNVLYNHIVCSINNLDPTGTNDEFKKRIVLQGLKMLSDELCPIYLSSNTDEFTKHTLDITSSRFDETNVIHKIPDHIANPHILNEYFQMINELMVTMDVIPIVKILLDDFKHYNGVGLCTDTGTGTDTDTDLNHKIFTELDEYKISFVEIVKETRTDRFANCSGTIVLFAHNLDFVQTESKSQTKPRRRCYYLVFDTFNKRINVCEDRNVIDDDGNKRIQLENVVLVLKRSKDTTAYETHARICGENDMLIFTCLLLGVLLGIAMLMFMCLSLSVALGVVLGIALCVHN